MNLFSYHVFLFPFQWYFTGKDMGNKTLEDRTYLPSLMKLFEGTEWVNRPYKTNTVLNYNEYNYFYDMARQALFDEGREPKDVLMKNLVYDVPPDGCNYKFKVCIDPRNNTYKEYSLQIDSIILHLYSVGVGILSFHLNNREESQSHPDDILRINQAGRRLYPPFFGIEKNVVGTQEQFNISDFSSGLDITMKNELAKEFSVISLDGFENFETYRNPEGFATNPFQLPNHIKNLFRGIPLTVDEADFKSEERKVFLSPLLDDRMFVICWYGNTELSNRLAAHSGKTEKDNSKNEVYRHDDWWYKFMFNDQSIATCQNQELKETLIQKHTYNRWCNFGTLYGINRYSFVCLTNDLQKLKDNNAHFILNHIQTLYYKLCELCLVQRACILRFSDEVSGISAMKDNKKIALSDRVSNLYKQYLRFVNRIYFREVTAQEQGIEIYNMMQQHMQIDRNVKDLDVEIEELHSYVTMMEQQKQSKNIEVLSIIGTLFILPSFLISFIGIIIIPNLTKSKMAIHNFEWILLPLVFGPLIYLFIDVHRHKRWNLKLLFFLLGIVIITFVLAHIYLCYYSSLQ